MGTVSIKKFLNHVHFAKKIEKLCYKYFHYVAMVNVFFLKIKEVEEVSLNNNKG